MGGILLGAVTALPPPATGARMPGGDRLISVDGVLNLCASPTASGVLVAWQTEGAANLVAFQVQRATCTAGPWTTVHAGWLTAEPDEPAGHSLRHLDVGAKGLGDVYRLVARDARGTVREYGPVDVVPGAAGPEKSHRLRQPFRSPGGSVITAESQSVRVAKEEQPQSFTTGTGSASSRLKITLRDTGLYFLSAQDIGDAMGWASNDVATLLGSHQLRLSNRGRKVAYVPAPAASGLYLFSESKPDVYCGEEIFWLERGRGLVLPEIGGAVPPGFMPAAGSFTETLHVETNLTFSTSAFNNPETDYWAWLLMAAGPNCSTSLAVRLPSATGSAGQLTVRLIGATSTGVSREHHVILSVNGTRVGEALWEGIVADSWSFDIPAGVLFNGVNQVGLESPLDAGVPYGFAYLDWMKLQFTRAREADGDQLLCPGVAEGPTTVMGFADPDVLVVDVSHADLPRRISGVQVQPANAAYAVSFATAGAGATYVVCARSGIRAATNLIASGLSNLRSASHRGDYVALSVPSLTNELARLLEHRRDGGWVPHVLLTQQIYDEFNHGRMSPHALKRWLAHALGQWSLPPTHVALVGEGSFDYRNYRGSGGCQVPPLLVNTPDGMFAADNQIGDVSGDDGVPEVAIGRLPAPTPETLGRLVDKIIACETAEAGPWLTTVVLAADNSDDAGAFALSSDTVAALLPAGLTQRRAYLDSQSTAAVRNTVLSGLNSGVVWLNYFGHGGWNGLASEGILSTSDLSSLTNRITPSVLTAMTCLINRFEVPGAEGFSERLLLEASGGVAAVWSATGLSYNDSATALDRAFYAARYQDGIGTLGGAARQALTSGRAQGVPRFELDIMTLLGDPALQLR